MKEVALQLWTKVLAKILVCARVCVKLMHALRLLIRNFQRLISGRMLFCPKVSYFSFELSCPKVSCFELAIMSLSR